MDTTPALIKPGRQVLAPVFSIQGHAQVLLADAIVGDADICIIVSRLHQPLRQVGR